MFRTFYRKHREQIDQFDGFLVNNTVLERGLVIAPVIVAANTLQNALILGMSFILITFFAILLSSFVPKKIPYTIRVILYVFISALLFIPVAWLMDLIFPDSLFKVGIFLPLLVTNSLIVTKTETRFFRETRGRMILDVLSHVMGFFVVIVVVGAIREIVGYGTIMNQDLHLSSQLYVMVLPFGGFILLGFLAAAVQRFRLYLRDSIKKTSGVQKGGHRR